MPALDILAVACGPWLASSASIHAREGLLENNRDLAARDSFAACEVCGGSL